MKLPKSILYYSAPYEGEESHARKRAETALALRELLSAPAEKGERRILPTPLMLGELSAASPERVTAFSLARERGRMDIPLFYTDAGDCLGDGELLLRSLLLAGVKASEYPLPLTCSAPACLPQLLCHFGCTQICLLGERTNIKAPVCRENAKNGYLWRSADGSECHLVLPKEDRAISSSEINSPSLRRAVFGKPSEEEETYCGEVQVDRKDAWEELAKENRRAADLLLGTLEPLTALLGANGTRVCSPAVTERLTGELLKNLSITDATAISPTVYAHRLDRVRTLTEEAEGYIAAAMETTLPSAAHGEEIAAISVFSPYTKQTAAQFALTLTLPTDRPFCLVDGEGNEIRYTICESRTETDGSITHRLTVLCPNLAPLAITRLFAVWGDPCVVKMSKSGENPRIENEFFVCETEGDRLKITCKTTRRVLQNPFFLEDQGDRGTDSFLPAQEGSLLFFPEGWTKTGDGLFEELYTDCRLDLPADYDFKNWERTTETRTLLCRLSLRLEKGSNLLRVSLRFADGVRRHRLRLAFRTDMMHGIAHRDAPFAFLPLEGTAAEIPGIISLAEAGESITLLTDTRRAVERVNDTLYVTLAHSADYRTGTERVEERTHDFAIFCARKPKAAALFEALFRFRRAPVALSRTFCGTHREGEGYPAALLSRPLISWDTPEICLTGCKTRADGSAVVHLLNPTDSELPVRLSSDRAMALSTLAEREEIRLTEGGSVGISLAPHQIIALLLQNPH